MILALIEHENGVPGGTSLEMLTLARQLASQTGADLAAVLFGEGTDAVMPELQRYGVGKVYLVNHPGLTDFAPDAWAAGLGQLAASVQAEAVLAAGTDRGNEVLARLAADSDLPMAANCVAVEAGEQYRIQRTRWGGSLFEQAWRPGNPKLMTVALHSLEAAEQPSAAAPAAESFTPELEEADLLVRVSGRIEPESGLSLGDARVVVGGGRGVGSTEGFAVLEELAELLGGVVGGSRVATNLGWRPHTDQIGQTGTRIAPDIYIACGISGATQHWVGCMGSKTILAINNDPEAPLVAKSDYAVIGDLHQVVPAISAEIRKVMGG
jgi:electron transfer flavoprotein alpha subunit